MNMCSQLGMVARRTMRLPAQNMFQSYTSTVIQQPQMFLKTFYRQQESEQETWQMLPEHIINQNNEVDITAVWCAERHTNTHGYNQMWQNRKRLK